MDVGVFVLVEVRRGVDDGLRLLRGGGVVEPDQRLAVDRLAQDREVVADGRSTSNGRDGPSRERTWARSYARAARRRR